MAYLVHVIIINFNAGDALLDCVASVLGAGEDVTVVVADNQSTDGSIAKLRSRHAAAPRLSIQENPANLGFGRAVNACARSATEPFLLILNPDCELFPDTLALMRQALEQDSRAALCAPVLVNHAGQPMRGNLRWLPDAWKSLKTGTGLWRLSRWFPGLAGVEIGPAEYPPDTRPVEAVSGACMLVKTDMFRELDGFDEEFPMHFEDLDLMARIQQAGLHCLLVPQARAIHQAGLSSASRPMWVHRQKHRGMQRYFQKHLFPHSSFVTRVILRMANWLHYLLGLPSAFLRQLRI